MPAHRFSKLTLIGVLLLYLSIFPSVCLGVSVIGHRGASKVAPENTLSSINRAASSADAFEFDVRVTADGKLVVMHDKTVDRTTNGTGRVSDYTLAEIQALDAGSWFSSAYAGEKIPTLEQAIQVGRSLGIMPMIERKSGGPSRYHAEFQRLGLSPSSIKLLAYDPGFLLGMHNLNPDYDLGRLMFGTPIDQSQIDFAKSIGADSLSWSESWITQEAVDLVHANGMELNTWTVNDPARMKELIQLGVDGIFTDRPEILDRVLIRTAADLNSDNIVNSTDLLAWQADYGMQLSGATFLAWQRGLRIAAANSDMNGNRIVDSTDLTVWQSGYGVEYSGANFLAWQRDLGEGVLNADFDGDGKVGSTDLGFWGEGYGEESGGSGFLAWQRQFDIDAARADINHDGEVNASDLSIWNLTYGTEASGVEFLAWQREYKSEVASLSTAIQSVPEPSTYLMLIAFLSGCGGLARVRDF